MKPNNFISPLQNIKIIEISGEQKDEYLHGQLTIDTKNFDENTARLAAHCDFKGKMFSVCCVSKYQDKFLLTTHKEAAQESLQQLKKYGVFSKVNIDFSEMDNVFGVFGGEATKQLKILFPETVNKHMTSVQNNFGQLISFNDTSERYLFIATEKGKQRLKDIIEDSFDEAEEYWELLEIEAGLANIQKPTMSEYVPQMLNLNYLDAIDFDKGCYMGQEVIARTKFLGKNKRATFIFKGETLTPHTSTIEPKVGDTIELKIGDNWRRGGTILRTVKISTEQKTEFTGLVVMANDTEVGSVIRLKESLQELTITPLPYAIDQ